MPKFNRSHFGCNAIGLAQDGTSTFTPVHGVQTVGLNTRFNLQNLFEVGQLSVYENVEDIPDVEATIEKCLDGWPLVYHLCTKGSASSSLAGRSNAKATLALSVYPDFNDAASGNPMTQAVCSGMFPSALAYEASVDGPAKETITLVGNNKYWLSTGFTFTPTVFGADVPYQTGNVNLRQHVLFQPTNATGTAFQQQYTLCPKNIPGISTSGTNDADSQGYLAVHMQRFSLSTNLGRENLLELGRRGPYHRYVAFPVEVRIDIDVITPSGDWQGATEAGILGNGNNLANQTIALKMKEGTYVDCGTKCKCIGVNMTGLTTQGGNVITTYSYQTFNDFKVLHPLDPDGFSG